MRIFIYFLLFLVPFVGFSNGIETYVTMLSGTDISTAKSLKVEAPKLVSNPTFTDLSVVNRLTFGIKPSSRFYDLQNANNQPEYNFTVVVEYKNEQNLTITKTLKIEYSNSPSANNNIDVLTIENGSYLFEPRIISVTSTKGDVAIPMPSDVFLESAVLVDRRSNMDVSYVPDNSFTFNDNFTNSKRDLIVSWDLIGGADVYDFEWVYVDDIKRTDDQKTYKPTSELFFDFKENSTRVTQATNYFTLPIIYETGYLLFRYRGVTLHPTNGKRLAEGPWSTYYNFPHGTGKVSDYPIWATYQITEAKQMPTNMNWSYSAGFAEEGKISESLSYMDGLGTARQSLVKSQTADVMLAQGVLLDFAGRPLISVMPSPVTENNWNYHTDLYKYNATTNFDASVFDKENSTSIDLKMDVINSKGSPNYFSSSNPNKTELNATIPDAKGYPFSQVIVDEQGRVAKVSGVGETHKIGSGKETSYYYVKPTQADLCEKFGTEVGIANNYSKTYVMDANGQMTVTYTDANGKVIATGLAGKSPDNLLTLGNTNNQVTVDLIETSNMANPKDLSYSVYEELVVLDDIEDPATQSKSNLGYAFNYKAYVEDFSLFCDPLNSLCFSCKYDLTISIRDDKNQEKFSKTIVVTPSSTSSTTLSGCRNTEFVLSSETSSTGSQPGVYFDKALKGGRYIIQKKLSLNTSDVDGYISSLLANTGCSKQYSEFEKTELSKIKVEDIKTDDCLSCEIAYRNYVNNLGEGNYTEAGRRALFEKCKKQCEITSTPLSNHDLVLSSCEEELARLSLDFMPGGQYATYQRGYNDWHGDLVSMEFMQRTDESALLRKQRLNITEETNESLNVHEQIQQLTSDVVVSDLKSPVVMQKMIEIESHLNFISESQTITPEVESLKQFVSEKLNAAEALGYDLPANQVEDYSLIDKYDRLSSFARKQLFSVDKYSIFNLLNELPNKKSSTGKGVKLAEIFGAELLRNDDGSSITFTDALSQGKLYLIIEQFKQEWASKLVELGFHPEGCYYTYCINTQASKDFDKLMLSTNTYQEAYNLGLLKSLPGMNYLPSSLTSATSLADPFFVTSRENWQRWNGYMFRVAFEQNLQNYRTKLDGTPYISIYQYAALRANDMSLDGSVLPQDIPLFGSSSCTRDLEWNYFKEAYLKLKAQYFEDARTKYAIENNCYNGCIGKGASYTGTGDVFETNLTPFNGQSFNCYSLMTKAPHCTSGIDVSTQKRTLMDQISAIENQINSITKELETSKEDLEQLKNYQSSSQKNLDEIKVVLTSNQTLKSTLQTRYSEISTTIVTLTTLRNTTLNQLTSLLAICNGSRPYEVKSLIAEKERRLTVIESIENSSSSTLDAQSLLQDQQKLVQLKQELITLQAEYDEIEKVYSYVLSTSLKGELTVETLTNSINILNDKLTTLNTNLLSNDEAYSTLQATLTTTIATRDSKQQQVDNMQAAFDANPSNGMDPLFYDLIDEIVVLDEQIVSLYQQISTNRINKTAIETQRFETLNDISQMQTNNASILADKTQENQDIESVTTMKVEAERNLAAKKEIVQFLEESINQRSALQESSTRSSNMEATQLRATITNLDGERQEAQAAAASGCTEEIRLQIHNLQLKLDEYNRQLRSLGNDQEDLLIKINELTLEIQRQKEKISDLTVLIGRLSLEITNISTTIETKSTTLETLYTQLADLNNQLYLLESTNPIGYAAIQDSKQLCYTPTDDLTFFNTQRIHDIRYHRNYGNKANPLFVDPTFVENKSDLNNKYFGADYRQNLIVELQKTYVEQFISATMACEKFDYSPQSDVYKGQELLAPDIRKTERLQVLNDAKSDLLKILTNCSSCVDPHPTGINGDNTVTDEDIYQLQVSWYNELNAKVFGSGFGKTPNSEFCNIQMVAAPVRAKLSDARMDGVACQKILTAQYEYLRRSTSTTDPLPIGVDSKDEMMIYLYNQGLGDRFDKLHCACKEAWNATVTSPIWNDYEVANWTPSSTWSADFENELVSIDKRVPIPLVGSTKSCTNCTTLSSKVEVFNTTFNYSVNGAIAPDQKSSSYWKRLTNYLNKEFNFEQTETFYQDQIQVCALLNSPADTEKETQASIDLKSFLNEFIGLKKYSFPYTMTYVNTPEFYNTSLFPFSKDRNSPINYSSTTNSTSTILTFNALSGGFTMNITLTLPVGKSLNNFLWLDKLTPLSTGDKKQFSGEAIMTNGERISFTGSTDTYTLLSSSYIIYGANNPYTICDVKQPRVAPQKTYSSIVGPQVVGAINDANVLYKKYADEVATTFRKNYTNYCYSNVKEEFTVSYRQLEYQFTLYYYDQVGNLTKTIPPKGFKKLTGTPLSQAIEYVRSGGANENVKPDHKMASEYTYDVFNRIISKKSPDGGITRYLYAEHTGELLMSQNAQQAQDNKCSYTKYDELGRVVEVGELSNTTVNSFFNDSEEAKVISKLKFSDFILATETTLSQVTNMYYDTPFGDQTLQDKFGASGQLNLNNRVAAATINKGIKPANATDYDAAVLFSYDEHGNVSRQLQINNNEVYKQFFPENNAKTIDYSYDLISGNVHEVVYQKDALDQFIHRYFYDKDNRLKEVETSKDGHVWTRDVNYIYHEYGALARMELGDEGVQGVDYVNTLQGWLKAVNSQTLESVNDVGQDALATGINRDFGKDVFGFNMHYFDGDYQSINPRSSATNFVATIPWTNVTDPTKKLKQQFNGNIAAVSNNMYVKDQSGSLIKSPILNTYEYDQLYRLRTSTAYKDFSNNAFGTALANNDYGMNITYDANGNIETLLRNASGVSGTSNAMDNFSYSYLTETNKLDRVSDAVSSTKAEWGDIKPGQGIGNYAYDLNGNLTQDLSEGIEKITWNAYGKIESVTHKLGSGLNDLVFEYDAFGRRATKISKPRNTITGVTTSKFDWTYTFYEYDASGNMMASYTSKLKTEDDINLAKLEIDGWQMYGSGRIGTETTQHPVISEKSYDLSNNLVLNLRSNALTGSIKTRLLGFKKYELTNHLGGVQAVITDRKFLSDDGTHFEAHQISGYDYFAFGMENHDRTWNGSGYQFTYNGMLKTNEIAGEGNSFSTEFRGYDPRLGRFFAQDRLSYFYPSTSTYVFALDNPIIGKDDNGLLTIFVNGYIHGGPDMADPYTGKMYSDDLEPGRPYWSDKGSQFIDAAHDYFGDYKSKFVNGTGYSILSTAKERQKDGREMGKKMAANLIKEILEHNAKHPEDPVKEINFVTHSMGAAYAEGMIEEFMKHPQLASLLNKGEIVHLSAADGDDIVISENSKNLNRTQLNYTGDFTLFYKDTDAPHTGGYRIPGVTRFGQVAGNFKKLHPNNTDPSIEKNWNFHYDTKTYKEAWGFIKALNQKYKSKSNKNDGKPIKLDYKDLPKEEKDGETKNH